MKAGASWEQFGAARGTSADHARHDYREWADGQHWLSGQYEGRFGMSDAEHAEAVARAADPDPGEGGLDDVERAAAAVRPYLQDGPLAPDAEPSPGFVHSMIARAAAAVAQANAAIRCLIILAHVISAAETPIRAGPGPKTRKRYLLVACTSLLTYYFLGDRSMATFTAFVLPDMGGTVLVHDRYQNYDAIPGLLHQLCTQHILRDLDDAAQTYPHAHWPAAITRALQGLIHAANTARAQGLPAIPGDTAAPLIHAFKHGVLVGLSQIPCVPGRKQEPCRDLLECLRDRHGRGAPCGGQAGARTAHRGRPCRRGRQG